MALFGKKKQKSETIFEDTSPLFAMTGLTAHVVVENDCSYLYLNQKGKMHATCWIKNHVKVQGDHIMRDDMARGVQPKVPAKYCDDKSDLGPLRAERLEIVWGAEGVSAFLYEGGELICAVPYWANRDFCGYSKFSCNSEAPSIPFALGDAKSNEMFKRAGDARTFWQQDFNASWGDYQETYMAGLESKFGKHLKYYAIDGGEFPAKAIATYEKDGVKYAFTIGVGMFPQPNEERPFFELGFSYQVQADDFDELAALSQISSIVTIPWAFNTYFDHCHTVDFVLNERHKIAVLISDEHVNVANLQLSGQKVNLLWLLPGADVVKADVIYKG